MCSTRPKSSRDIVSYQPADINHCPAAFSRVRNWWYSWTTWVIISRQTTRNSVTVQYTLAETAYPSEWGMLNAGWNPLMSDELWEYKEYWDTWGAWNAWWSLSYEQSMGTNNEVKIGAVQCLIFLVHNDELAVVLNRPFPHLVRMLHQFKRKIQDQIGHTCPRIWRVLLFSAIIWPSRC